MITIEISERFGSKINAHLIEKAAFTTLQYQSVGDVSGLTIFISDDEHLQSLNFQFRDINAPTDVLSFPADFTDPENETPYLGDVVISYQRAADQAMAGGHVIMAEIQLLVVHGVLHILGHDHALPVEKAEMWKIQNEILHLLGLSSMINPEGE